MSSTIVRRWNHGPIAWMANNRVTANLLMLVFLIGGLYATYTIKQEVFPDFAIDVVKVTVSYPNASPEEVERGIILAVESAVRGVDGVKEINATASEGSASVSVDLIDGTDRQQALDDIQQAVDRISTLPDDAEDPIVKLVSHRREVVNIQLYGDVPELSLRTLGEEVRDRLLQYPGITQVDLEGDRDYEIHVEIPSANLRAHGLTLQDVATKIGALAIESPSGTMETASGDILLRVSDRREWASEFAQIPIVSSDNGTIVRLGDIATVRDTLEDTTRWATYNGLPSIGVSVYELGDQTPIGVSAATRAAMEAIEAELPPGVSYSLNRDMSEVYAQRLQLLLRNAFMGLALVLVLLGAFLDFKLAFWVTMGIPTSFLGGLLFLSGMDMSINMMSMFAFIIALGIVVDDAIVAGENIYEYRQRGMPFLEAAIRGARDIAVPIGFSIATNVVAFIPLYFVPGVMGRIFGVIPLVVVTVFLVSWVEALFILPAHLGHARRTPGNAVSRVLVRGQRRVADGLMRFVDKIYQPFLRVCVDYRYATVAAAMALLMVVLAYAMSGRIGFILMPRAESDFAVASAVLPVGSPEDKTVAVRDRLVKAAEKVAAENGGKDLLDSVIAVVAGNELDVRFILTDPDIRPISTSEVARLWRQAAGSIPGLESLKFASDRGGPGSGAALNIELSHRDIRVLEQAAATLAGKLEEFPQVSDVDDGSASGKRQISLQLRPEGLSLGLTATDVAKQVRAAFYGTEALSQQRGLNEVKVLVRLPENERASEADIEQFLIRTAAGTDVPLRQVADMSWGHAYTSITRHNARRVLQVTADVNPIGDLNQIVATLNSDVLPALQQDYAGLTYRFEGRQADMAESMNSLMASFILAILAIYVLLAIPFRDYIQPVIVMTSLPLGIVGAVLGHMVMGYNLSVVSVMGIVALSGVVINDSLVMIDYANRRRTEGEDSREAIIQAGMRRFRPILLTTLTTFGGLAPMIFETSRQARFMIPMALSLGFGILFATAIILVFIPSLYVVVEDIRAVVRRWFADTGDEVADAESLGNL